MLEDALTAASTRAAAALHGTLQPLEAGQLQQPVAGRSKQGGKRRKDMTDHISARLAAAGALTVVPGTQLQFTADPEGARPSISLFQCTYAITYQCSC